jgi:hypothetical protein
MDTALRIVIYGTRGYDRQSLSAANTAHGFDLHFIDRVVGKVGDRLPRGRRVRERCR